MAQPDHAVGAGGPRSVAQGRKPLASRSSPDPGHRPAVSGPAGGRIQGGGPDPGFFASGDWTRQPKPIPLPQSRCRILDRHRFGGRRDPVRGSRHRGQRARRRSRFDAGHGPGEGREGPRNAHAKVGGVIGYRRWTHHRRRRRLLGFLRWVARAFQSPQATVGLGRRRRRGGGRYRPRASRRCGQRRDDRGDRGSPARRGTAIRQLRAVPPDERLRRWSHRRRKALARRPWERGRLRGGRGGCSTRDTPPSVDCSNSSARAAPPSRRWKT